MLDNFTIFARGGIILFSWSAVTLKGGPIDSLISTVLLEERSGQQSYPYSSGTTKYTLKWTFNNDLGIVLVAVCDTARFPAPPERSRVGVVCLSISP